METGAENIYVYLHRETMPEALFIGTLHVQQSKGRKSFSFEYDNAWLKNKEVFLLDPEIALFSGRQYPSGSGNFGVFMDSMPDTWGRTLMKRRATQIAKAEGRPAPALHETDYLLGVDDQCRMGALRFKTSQEGLFLAASGDYPVPPWVSVGELQHIAKLVETETETVLLNKWLVVLMAPGASLGGARPKANIKDKTGHLWIAKFPSCKDTIDKAQWEFLAYKLACASGIEMSESKIKKIAGNHCTFFTKRFDRDKGKRIHFASAMTLTGNSEDTLRDATASYLELALFIQNHCGNVKDNLKELWRRIVFNIAVSNTDDHLRNHGFIVKNNVWKLSPAFDINPSIDKEALALNIDESSGALDFELAMSVIDYFRLSHNEAIAIMNQIKHAVSPWEKTAKSIGISPTEIELMRQAFRF